MRAEWKRRTVAISIAVLFAGMSRSLEMHMTRLTFDPVWITRFLAIAALIVCFRLADMIPDIGWDRLRPPAPTLMHAAVLISALIISGLLYSVAH